MGRIRTSLVKVAMALGALVVTLVVLEVCLRLVAPQPLNLYNFALLNEEGIVVKAATPGHATLYRTDTKPPGEGPMRANARMRMGYVDIEVNEHGWRDRVYPQNGGSGAYRLVVVGDSVTFGYGVALAETYHKRLEDRLNQAGSAAGRRFEVAALAGGGGTTYDALRMVRRHAGYFRPRELWLAFNLNDILFNPYFPWEKHVKADAAGQAARTGVAPSLSIRAAMLLRWLRARTDQVFRSRSHLYHLVRQRTKVLLRQVGIYSPTMQPEAAFAFSSAPAQEAWSATLAAIVEMREEAARHGARFAVVVLPADPQTSSEARVLYRDQFRFRFDDDFAGGVVQQWICQDLVERGIECLDPLPRFRAHAYRQLFLRVHGDSIDWNHPNAVGHAVLAEALFAAMKPRLLPAE